MKKVLALLMCFSISPALADIECVIKYPAPPQYASVPLPAGTITRFMPLAEVQRAYFDFTGKRSFGTCGVLGFVAPGNPSTIFVADDVSCWRDVLRHEEAHVKGWPASHPNTHTNHGPCSNV